MRINRQFLAMLALGGIAAASVAANAASLTHNGEQSIYEWDPLVSQRSRAEVNAEAVAVVAAGATSRGDSDPLPATFVSTKTRAEVRAEAVEALRLGLIPHSEFSAREATATELELVRLAGQRARAAEDRLAGK